ncbi:hypothetical protein [Rhodococcus sp. IEGM 1379]|uniref:hypothetical protein n=1 Tax=Rhodococcus sp. IEGM 1379 TaxID=3047086 RepID=UPI0024B713BC|nr:hypothetical protein [Rhodococcus sp. IEGM 1379]MDI9915574.1 hypothetical protein [Rhodococcus sp. IEGM 1379]
MSRPTVDACTEFGSTTVVRTLNVRGRGYLPARSAWGHPDDAERSHDLRDRLLGDHLAATLELSGDSRCPVDAFRLLVGREDLHFQIRPPLLTFPQ